MTRPALRPLPAPDGAISAEVLTGDGERAGLAALRPSAWDSEHFGFPIGKLDSFAASTEEAAATLAAWVDERAAEAGWELVMGRVPAGDPTSISALEACGFRYRETTLVPEAPIDALSTEDPGPGVRTAREDDRAALSAIARTAFRLDHFHLDPRIDAGKADELYVRWVGTWLDDRSGRKTLTVCERDGRVAGFMASELEPGDEGDGAVCDMVLAGVHPDMQGRGVGRAVMLGAIRAARSAGVRTGRSRVTAANAATMVLHQHVGFTLTSPEVTLHRWYDHSR